MSNERNDGGPAFPADSFGSQHNPGMSLRDWFAGQALVGFITADDGCGYDAAAEWSYAHADAMLAAREVRS